MPHPTRTPRRGDRFDKLSKAPIVEAIIDIRVEPRAEEAVHQCAALIDSLPEKYSGLKEEIRAWEHRFAFADAPVEGLGTSQRLYGYRRATPEGSEPRQYVQARLDGFTMNQLAPYDCWETFVSEGRELWNQYREKVAPKEVVRVALRYINRIELPAPITNLADHFNTLPVLATNLNYMIGNHLMRFQVEIPDIDAGAVINCTTCAAQQGYIGFSFDIDVFKSHAVPQEEDAIWAIFEQLRHEKNFIFFSSITDTTRGFLE